jgi:3-keto-5-aminohexanoate cleavage enzyme
VPGSIPATAKNLFFLYESLPPGCPWTITAVGPQHVDLMTMALALGGNVRVGLEDNIYYAKGILADNPSLVRRAKGIILAMGKEVATPAEARQMLSLI